MGFYDEIKVTVDNTRAKSMARHCKYPSFPLKAKLEIWQKVPPGMTQYQNLS